MLPYDFLPFSLLRFLPLLRERGYHFRHASASFRCHAYGYASYARLSLCPPLRHCLSCRPFRCCARCHTALLREALYMPYAMPDISCLLRYAIITPYYYAYYYVG